VPAFQSRPRLAKLVNTHGHRLFAVGDQAFQGVANLAASAILARALPRAEFGAIGMMIGFYYVVNGIHRGAVTLPYVIDRTGKDQARHHSNWWWLSVLGALAVLLAQLVMIAAAVLAAWIKPEWQWIVQPLILSAVITGFLLLFEHGRRWCYQVGDAKLAAISSAVYFFVLVGASAAVARWAPHAWIGALGWVVAASTAIALILAIRRPRRPDWEASVAKFRENRRFAMWQSFSHIAYSFYSNASCVVLIGLILGPLSAAVFTAVTILCNPAFSLVSAIDSTDKPLAARRFAENGITGLRASVAGTRKTLLIVTGAYLGAIAIFAEQVTELVFGGRYPGISPEVRILALAFFARCLNQPSETVLIVLKASRSIMATRVVTAVLTLVGLILAKPAGVVGMAAALLVVSLVNAGLLILAEWRAAKRVSAATAR
jgi:O-antigen/teichoic acid export membrane protein